MPSFYFGLAPQIIRWATSRKYHGLVALCGFCCLLVSWLVWGFFREWEYKKYSAWKAWQIHVNTCITCFSELEEANGDLLSSFVFLLCISAQEKDIHVHSLKSHGCHMC